MRQVNLGVAGIGLMIGLLWAGQTMAQRALDGAVAQDCIGAAALASDRSVVAALGKAGNDGPDAYYHQVACRQVCASGCRQQYRCATQPRAVRASCRRALRRCVRRCGCRL